MKKIILLCITFMTLAYGYNYDELVLKAQASIFPKIMLLDKKLEEKLIDGKIVYAIVYDASDYATAVEIRDFIDTEYQGHWGNYAYEIKLVEFTALSNDLQASAIYVLNSNENIAKVAQISKDKGIVAFSYDVNNLKQGLSFSLMLEKSTVLYLNKNDLYTNKIDFVDALLQIVKFIDEDTA